MAFNEYIQFSEDGWKKYIKKDPWNLLDCFMILSMYVSGISRILIDKHILPSVYVHNNLDNIYGKGFLLYTMILDIIIFIVLFFKSMFYFRINPQFGMLVNIVYGVQANLMPFMLFLIIICMFFAAVFAVLGGTFPSIGNHVITGFSTFINTFEIFVGNTPYPNADFWINLKK